MLHSPNLNVIVKSLEKISVRLSRDFVELENLQNNNFSAIKFANSCYKRIEEDLVFELKKVRGNYNIELASGEKITNDPNSQYYYLICPIDGLFNLSRSLPSFTSFVALAYLGENGQKQIISSSVLNVASNELYSCEKGSGAFLRNRKIRCSKREISDGVLGSLSKNDLINHPLVKKLQENKANFSTNNCSSLDIAYFASGKIDFCIFEEKDNFLDEILLLATEAGGKITKKDGLVLIGNEKINFNTL